MRKTCQNFLAWSTLPVWIKMTKYIPICESPGPSSNTTLHPLDLLEDLLGWLQIRLLGENDNELLVLLPLPPLECRNYRQHHPSGLTQRWGLNPRRCGCQTSHRWATLTHTAPLRRQPGCSFVSVLLPCSLSLRG